MPQITLLLFAGVRRNDELARVLERSAWSVDEEMVDEEREDEVLLKGGETVCPIPPVSGG
ncbi:hypothetical protein RTBOTA2_004445 [Rhodotorula toruloides]|uniref:Uncharacterized protein n=1 Tax=Rhodotorula toruloides TaxID=5286 RepID=A0A2T0AI26_RHOTO|nr:hypothetical protein RTBOTA2_004445 [Rhodotorula toruloides]PRQ77642.1 hypothetical protein AAT19DRAFT_8710 [Rhodotorula toruloides]